MRIVLQRVKSARVLVEGETAGEIAKGFLILLGVSGTDNEKTADLMADKICKLRIFEDENGKTNLSLSDVGGALLVVSQFTLYADCKKGNRPSFAKAGEPGKAEALYKHFISRCKEKIPTVEHGVFGAHMEIELVNDGPFTLVLEGSEHGVCQEM